MEVPNLTFAIQSMAWEDDGRHPAQVDMVNIPLFTRSSPVYIPGGAKIISSKVCSVNFL